MNYFDSNEVKIDDIIGKTFVSVENVDDETILFTDSDGVKYSMQHCQDCCESVTVDDICGDLQDLVGSPIVTARENTSDENPQGVSADTIEYQESFTWTFYDFATIKGSVTIRWYGESNGYYSESVDFLVQK